MNAKEVVQRTVHFNYPDRLAVSLDTTEYEDILVAYTDPNPDKRLANGTDSWGAVWRSFPNTTLGEVVEFPLKSYQDLNTLRIPDVNDPTMWDNAREFINKHPDKYICGHLISIYERPHYLRGLENIWMDIYDYPDELGALLDLIVDMNITCIKKYAELGVQGMFFSDDWGLQDRLMISPSKWCEIWKPRYARLFKACHDYNLDTFMHSCGYIVDILDELIEAGLDVIQIDQQLNMGLELLSSRFRGRITFFSPVDIQAVMPTATTEEVRSYALKMTDMLGTDKGGFIGKWYGDPIAVGHSKENIVAQRNAFLDASKIRFGK